MRTATEAGSAHHIFSHLFYSSHAGYCILLNPCNANTGLRRPRVSHFSRTVRPGYIVSYTLSAIHCQRGRTFSLLCLTTFVLRFLIFFEYVLVFFSFYTTTYLLHAAIVQKILVIMPHYPCFSSCVVLYGNSSFTYNEAALEIRFLRLLEKVLRSLQDIKDIPL